MAWLGVRVVVAGVAWLADPLFAFGLPEAPAPIRRPVEVPTSIGELGLLLYLLVRGVRGERPAGAENLAPA